MKKEKQKQKSQNGITLIALVVTIVVLLILAGVSITTLFGNNGILTRANTAKEQSRAGEVDDQIRLWKNEWKIYNIIENSNEKPLSEKEFLEYLETNNWVNENEIDIENKTIKIGTTVISYDIGIVEKREYIETTKSYVGYYVDSNYDGLPDGVIYADLAVGIDIRWDYEFLYRRPERDGLKNYYISDEYDGVFGENGVLVDDGGGDKERFYVMALEDINPGTSYCMYSSAQSWFNSPASNDDFGEGKANTSSLFGYWDSAAWGSKSDNDLWWAIKSELKAGWFVPSKSEWDVFDDYLDKNCGMTSNNYNSVFGLSSSYWSSSQAGEGRAFAINFSRGFNAGISVIDGNGIFVRLTTTF